MLPENTPALKGKCAEEFARKIGQPLSQKQLKIYEDADKVFKAIKPRKAIESKFCEFLCKLVNLWIGKFRECSLGWVWSWFFLIGAWMFRRVVWGRWKQRTNAVSNTGYSEKAQCTGKPRSYLERTRNSMQKPIAGRVVLPAASTKNNAAALNKGAIKKIA